MKRRGPHPAANRAPRAKEDPRRVPPLVPVELRGVDGLYSVGQVDHARWADQRLQRHPIYRCAAGNEVHWRVDVRSAMRAHRIDGEGESIPFAHVLEELE